MERIIDSEYHQWFDSFEELTKLTPEMINRKNSRLWAQLQENRHNNTSWFGGPRTIGEMHDKVINGWPEMRTRTHLYVKQLNDTLETTEAIPIDIEHRRRKRTRGDYGDTLDIHRVWAGELDKAWERPTKKPRLTLSERYVTLYADLCASSGKDAFASIWRAAVAIKLVDLYTQAGYSLEVWVGNSARYAYPGSSIVSSWYASRVKEYSMPVHEERFAAMLGVGYLRAVGFAQMVAGPYGADYSLGYPANEGLPLPLRERAANGERVLRVGECYSFHDAIRQLKKLAEPLQAKANNAAVH